MKGAARPSMTADPRQKERLQAELSAIREQKRKVEREIAEKEGKPVGVLFPALKTPVAAAAAPALPPPLDARTTAKRPSLHSQGGGDIKKQKTGESADKAREEIWKQINKIHNKLHSKTESLHFRQPVDIIASGVPDYYNIIKRPMDLGTVKNKLNKHQYASPQDYCNDVRQIWENCRTYNAPGHAVRKQGDSMSDFFEKLWVQSKIESQWDQLMETPPSWQQQVERILPSYRDTVRKVVPKASASNDPLRDMIMEEKRKLSVDLSELSADRLADCLRIITEQMPEIDSMDPEHEIELDIDALTSATLWRLRDLIDRQRTPPALQGARGSAPSKLGPPSKAHQPPAVQHNHNNAGTVAGNGNHNRTANGDAFPSSSHQGGGGEQSDPTAFIRPGGPVAESGIQSKNQKTFVGSQQAARKTEAPKINSAAWDMDGPATNGGAEDGADTNGGTNDELWSEFQTREQQLQQKTLQAEQLRKAKEEQRQQELDASLASARRQVEEEERAKQQLADEERRKVEENLAQREALKAQELQELQNRANTAGMLHQPDDLLPDMDRNHAHDMSEIGLTMRHAAGDADFDD